MIPVAEALERLFGLVRPLPAERVPLVSAHGRVTTGPITALYTQPPFAASAMDGYAVAGDPAPGDSFTVIGEAAAGHPFPGTCGPGQAVRIFTGAPMPDGADRVLIQEDVDRNGDRIILRENADRGRHVRPAGGDFSAGDTLPAPRRLGARDVALIAAMGHAEVEVARRPEVALIATGDELVPPGTPPGPGQITASNGHGLHARLAELGARPRLLPIARDTEAALTQAFDLARGADLIVTIGGASVGDHDLVAPVAERLGMDRAFYKIAMRPGKPLMAGRMGEALVVGLPGNPVSSMVCAEVFLRPLLAAMQGLPPAPVPTETHPLAHAMPEGGPRTHYMRGRFTARGVEVFDRQDSSLLTVLAEADLLAIRPIDAPPAAAGDPIEVIRLGR